jgi:hypothetical protein
VQPLDLLKAVWILFIFVTLFFLFPTYLFPERNDSPAILATAGNFVRALFLVTVASSVLASLKMFNATTVILLFVGAVAIAWIRKRAKSSRNWLSALQELTIGILRLFEGQQLVFRPQWKPIPSDESKRVPWWAALHGNEFVAAAFAVVAIITGVLYFVRPLQELRLDRPEQYESLLRGRELMLNIHAHDRPLAFPAVIATTAIVSSMDPMQVTRFLAPVFELALVLSAGLLVWVSTRGAVAAIVTVYCLGTAALQVAAHDAVAPASTVEKLENIFRSSLTRATGSPEVGIGLICLILALAFLADWQTNSRGWSPLLDAIGCLLLVGVVSRFLLLICLLVSGAVLFRPALGVILFVVTTCALAACAVLPGSLQVPIENQWILPLAVVLGVGCFLGWVESRLLAPMGKTAEQVLLVACIAVAVLWFRPQPLAARYLEYDEAASQTRVIADHFPRQRWAVVAPTEQFAETLGLGGYQDLAQFVEKYQGQVSDPEFHIPDAPEDLFVYVEKRPFQFFSHEPEFVPIGVLADSTYRSYRSPAGRASLESAALRLCESYRQSHNDADVFFEDEALRIYHVRRQLITKSGTGG